MEFLDVSGEDISKLNDTDLRKLVGLLCEAEYRSAGQSTAGITWGGSQDAPDGGLDVVAKNAILLPENSFIPKKNTGFQVKKSSMPPSSILKEMRPKGLLRKEIETIGEHKGAYIIISSGDSTSDSALRRRVESMKEAVKPLEPHKTPFLDFYDRGRIASWTRLHPTCVLWLWNKIGNQINGWLPYGNWSGNSDNVEEEYLTDDDLRLFNNTTTNQEGVTIEEGISKLRSSLRPPKASVRLTGLSGVGKTRLVEALFDERIGNEALNPSLAIYTDISFSPSPESVDMASQLVANEYRGILIVDNCPPDLHRTLTKVCSKQSSNLSLLTVEYDIRDDLPEETDVFRLEPASKEVIEKLVKSRFTFVSDVDARTISEFSGGNARVAIALANTLKKGDSLNNLRDEELFQRLFKQRNNDDKDLLKSAQICSLVYSFEGIDIDSEKSELKILAKLIDRKPSELYRDVSSLRDRGLVQSRSVWRAVLPHAIANRLAEQALKQISKDTIVNTFQTSSERMLKSFSKRLSYLHDNEVAIKIVEVWMAKDGLIGNSIHNFNNLGISMFRNLAPISPELTLKTIERAANSEKGNEFTSRANIYYYEFVRILALIAYDESLFDRSVELIIRFALSERPEENTNSTRNILKGLFQLHISGTKATHLERANVIEKLLADNDKKRNDLGVLLINSSLNTWHFTSAFQFQFGARSRDYGYQPQTKDQYVNWYKTFVLLCSKYGMVYSDTGKSIRRTLANNLRGLIARVDMYDVIENVIQEIHSKYVWNDCWLAIKSILRYDKERLPEDLFGRIVALEKSLRPDSLINQIRVYSLTDQRVGHFDIEDEYYDEGSDYRAAEKRMRDKTFDLGTKLANNRKVFQDLLPDLFSTSNRRLFDLGRGLANGSGDKKQVWDELMDKAKLVDDENRSFTVMFGFLAFCGDNARKIYDSILDEALEDIFLKKWFPSFQGYGTIDSRALQRLHRCLDADDTLVWTYSNLSYGKAYNSFSDDELAKLMEKLGKKEGGSSVVADILYVKFLRDIDENTVLTETLVKTSFELLSNFQFGSSNARRAKDYELAAIADACLSKEYDFHLSDRICQNVLNSIEANDLHPTDYNKFLATLAKRQPKIFLDTFLFNNESESYGLRFLFRDSFERTQSPLNEIPDEALLDWCMENVELRYPMILERLCCFMASNEDDLVWKPLVLNMLAGTDKKEPLLNIMRKSIDPTSWSGSRAEILRKRIVLFDRLLEHSDIDVKNWAEEAKEKFLEYIEQVQEWEEERNRVEHESFE